MERYGIAGPVAQLHHETISILAYIGALKNGIPRTPNDADRATFRRLELLERYAAARGTTRSRSRCTPSRSHRQTRLTATSGTQRGRCVDDVDDIDVMAPSRSIATISKEMIRI
jgi:hypothetical protein